MKSTADEELAAYRAMLMIRRFEEKTGQLIALGIVRADCKLSIGREAIIVGMTTACRPSDQVVTADLGHGHMLALGVEPVRIFAELLARPEGSGLPDRMSARERGFMGMYPGAQAAAIAGCGLALANSYLRNSAVCLCFLGRDTRSDFATARVFAMAADLKLPIVFVTETATMKPASELTVGPVSDPTLCIAEERIDGTSVRKVRNAGRLAFERARSGEGPVVLNMLVYPYRGHDEPAETRRMTRGIQREDVDAIAKSRRKLLDGGDASDADLKSIEAAVRAGVNTAAAAAKAAHYAGLRGLGKSSVGR